MRFKIPYAAIATRAELSKDQAVLLNEVTGFNDWLWRVFHRDTPGLLISDNELRCAQGQQPKESLQPVT